ncbi:MAG: DUF4331 domain-containing protein [Armatimonadetes bacterium]|nr:DUF4331 domain-containing protein [Armatimonadota bacterium]
MRPLKLALQLAVLLAVGAALTLSGAPSRAASHSDAPLIKQDPQANITDVYTFIGTKYNNPSQRVLNVIVHVHPFSEPGDGVIYDRFADDALYSIHIANPTAGETVLRYDFQFSDVNPLTPPGLKNPNTIFPYGIGTEIGPILDVGDARQNYVQTYTVSKVEGRRSRTIGSELLTSPPNVGLRTTPFYNDPTTGKAVSGAIFFDALDRYTRQTVFSLPAGEAVFAGPREDGFFADTPGIFDLLDPRIVSPSPPDTFGQAGSGVDGFKGFNVLAYAIQIPVDSLPSFGYTAPFADLANPLPAVGPANGWGVYASVSRRRITLRRDDRDPQGSGPWIQVNRMGNPLFNEVLVALEDKDRYNRTSPTVDASQFATYALNPEIAVHINAVFGLGLVATGRTDLAAVYIPDVIRVDTTTPPVRLAGQSGFSRFGFAGGDTTTDSAGRIKSSGWPNGRRLGDDVIDIALTAVASGPTYSSVIPVGDNIAANDQVYNQVFPYSGTPHSGARNSKDSGINDE